MTHINAIIALMPNKLTALLFIAVASLLAGSCAAHRSNTQPPTPVVNANPTPTPTPSNKFTNADIAKLKWIEGTWRGMDGNTPFYERYTIQDGAMITETLKEDGSVEGDPDRFELTNGEFGKGEGDKRVVATEITDTYVQFVPAGPGTQNSFRFEKQSEGTWIALLEWPANGDKPAGKKIYLMQPWEPGK